jgi:predicted alpha/beta-fold hydrolase
MIPASSVRRFALPGSGLVTREILLTGGHVGFAAPTKAPGRFWAAERALSFLAAHG